MMTERQPTPGVHESFADKQSPGNRAITGRTAREGDRHPLPPITNVGLVELAATAIMEHPNSADDRYAMHWPDARDYARAVLDVITPAPESHAVGNDFEALAKQIEEAERLVSGGPWCDGYEPIENRDHFARMVRKFAKNLPARQVQATGIRALGWVTCGDISFASTPFGSYEVRPSRSSRHTDDRYELLVPGEKIRSAHFATEALGREAAEADFKHRVSACIYPPAPQAKERCRDCDGYNCDDGCAYPDPSPQSKVVGVSPPRWRVFEDITHGWWGIEEDIHDGNTVLYPKKINREALDGIVRAHNAALASEGRE